MESEVTPEWQSTFASLKGSSHGLDAPNQDAVRVEKVFGVAASTWIAAVADGHGGPRYVRSDVGSQFAVDVAIKTVTDLLDSSAGEDLDLLRVAAPLIVEAWRRSVLTHLTETPFSDDESARAGSLVTDNPVIAYGATLLIAVVNHNGVRLAQIGDGDALVRTHGYAVRPIPGDARLIANETTSLCLDTAATDFRFAELPSSAEVDLVLLASDGYGNSFAAPDWWHTLVRDVAWYVDVHSFEEFSGHLPEWLAESALVGGDDVTAAVLSLPEESRPAPAVIPGTPDLRTPEHAAESATSGLTAVPPPRRGSRRALVAALVVGLLAAAAAAAGYALSNRNGTPEPVPPTTISPSPSDSASPSESGSSTSDPPKKRKNPKPDKGDSPALPGGADSENLDQPPADVPDRPTDPKGRPKSDP